MKSNESAADRIIRVVIGLALGALVAFKVVTGALAIVLGIVAVLAFVTGAAGICAVYALFGASTRASARAK